LQRIFVGDVQGCASELQELLERARGRFGSEFELWQVGDLVNRGPDSLCVLETARELRDAGRARLVLGNHELGLLRVFAGQRALEPGDTYGDVLAAGDAAGWIDWLRRLPLVEVADLGPQRFAMIHAGVDPGWDLAELVAKARAIEARLQAPDRREAFSFLAEPPRAGSLRDALARLTRCRSAALDGSWSAEPPGTPRARGAERASQLEPWHRLWRERGHDFALVYGHWALQGLHVEPRLRGLDTACVHHGRNGIRGRLTAWLPDPASATPFGVPDEHFWHAAARRVYGAR